MSIIAPIHEHSFPSTAHVRLKRKSTKIAICPCVKRPNRSTFLSVWRCRRHTCLVPPLTEATTVPARLGDTLPESRPTNKIDCLRTHGRQSLFVTETHPSLGTSSSLRRHEAARTSRWTCIYDAVESNYCHCQ